MKDSSLRPVVSILMRMDCTTAAARNTLWTRIYGGGWQDCASSVTRTQDGGLVLCSTLVGNELVKH